MIENEEIMGELKESISEEKRINSLLAFNLITFAISWFFWAPLAISQTHDPILHFLGGFGPFLATIICTLLFDQSDKLANIFRSLLFFWYDFDMYAYAILLPSIPVFLGYILYYYVRDQLILYRPDPFYWIGGFLISILILSLEEIGWRGYMLPKLLKLTTPMKASVILGIIWAFWHLPLFFYAPPHLIQHWSLENFLFQFVSYVFILIFESIFMTWAFRRSGGSLLMMLLVHASFNASIYCFKPEFLEDCFFYINIMAAIQLVLLYKINKGII